MAEKKKMTMGLIVGNRGFFPDHQEWAGRDAARVAGGRHGGGGSHCARESKCGAVETREESRRWAELYEAQESQESDPEHSGFTATSRGNGCVKSGDVPYHE